MRGDPSDARRGGGFESSIDPSMQHSYPLFIGRPPIVGSGTARSVASHAFSPFKLRRYRREFREDVFNPDYLMGTGLVIDQHGQALLVAGPEPDVIFYLEHLTLIEVVEDVYNTGVLFDHKTKCRVFLHIDGFHALTLHRFKHGTAREIVSALTSIRDVPFTYQQFYHEMDAGGDGGGGGG